MGLDTVLRRELDMLKSALSTVLGTLAVEVVRPFTSSLYISMGGKNGTRSTYHLSFFSLLWMEQHPFPHFPALHRHLAVSYYSVDRKPRNLVQNVVKIDLDLFAKVFLRVFWNLVMLPEESEWQSAGHGLV